MRILLQRVKQARVEVDQKIIGQIDKGYLLYVAFGKQDTEDLFAKAIDKILNLRIYENSQGKMDLNLQDMNGSLLVVSQFTLYGNCQRGRRPDFTQAMAPKQAVDFYEKFLYALNKAYPSLVESGEFAANMQVYSINDGPLSFMLEW